MRNDNCCTLCSSHLSCFTLNVSDTLTPPPPGFLQVSVFLPKKLILVVIHIVILIVILIFLCVMSILVFILTTFQMIYTPAFFRSMYFYSVTMQFETELIIQFTWVDCSFFYFSDLSGEITHIS